MCICIYSIDIYSTDIYEYKYIFTFPHSLYTYMSKDKYGIYSLYRCVYIYIYI